MKNSSSSSKPRRQKLFFSLSIIVLGFLISFGSLTSVMAAEGTRLAKSRISRSIIDRAYSLVAPLEVTDFNLSNEYAESEILIKFSEWAPDELIDSTILEFEGEKLETSSQEFTRVKIMLDRLREPRIPREWSKDGSLQAADIEFIDVLELIDSLPHVEWVEVNSLAFALTVPNDPYYPLQWNLPLVGTLAAWEQTQGANVTIAVLDTGIAYEKWKRFKQAPDLANTKFVPGYNTIRNNQHANDDNGHGTHVTGTIAGSANNSLGVAGLAYNASIMPVKVLNHKGVGTYADIAEGIYWAVDNGADIINLSLGGPVASNTLYEAMRYAYDRNVLVVAAAGNDGQGSVLYPAAFDEYVLAVGAIRYDKTKAPYSSYGTSLDLVAPGGDTTVDQNKDGYADGVLQETLYQRYGRANTGKFAYYFYQGTSMAAPHVAGVAALVKSLGINDIGSIKQILVDSAEDINSVGWDKQTGFGLVRADLAVELANQTLADASQPGTEPDQLNTSENDSTPNIPIDEIPETPVEEPVSEPAPDEEPPVEETPAEEPPAPEPEEESMLDLALEASTYNMWGRPDSRFSFWENAILGIEVTDNSNNSLGAVDIDIKVFDSNDNQVAQGNGQSDSVGELWLQLGNFSKGAYKIVVEAIKEGFNLATQETSFRFR